MQDQSSPRTKHASDLQGVASPRCPARSSSPFLLLTLLGLLVSCVTLFAHWPSLSAGALGFDGSEYLTDNPLVRRPSLDSATRFIREVTEPSTVHGYYQPLTMISLMLDYAVAGGVDNLRPFHRTSLALHVANTVLVMVLLYLLFGEPWVAAMVGLLFGVHPMTVETIPWIGERKTLLAAFFALWCLIAYVGYARRPDWRLYAICVLLYLMALASKPTSTPLPVVMLLMDFWPLRRWSKRTLLEKLPLLAIAAVFSVITVVSQGRTASVHLPGEYPAGHIPLILCHNIIFYLSKIVWPTRLTSHYPFPQPMGLSDPMVLAGVVGTCILIPLLLISLRWTRAFATGWLMFFVAIFPAMGVLGFTIVIASDKYAYLPAIGLLMILAWLLAEAWSPRGGAAGRLRRVVIVGIVLAVASVLVTATRGYARVWRTEETLGNHMVALAPRSAPVYLYRGGAYYLMGDYEKSIQDCTKAIAIKSDYAAAYDTRGLAHNGRRDHEQAIRDFSQAIQLSPNYAPSYNGRAIAAYRKGDYDQAVRDWSKAVEIRPDYVVAFNSRGAAYCMKGEYAKAIRDYDRSIALSPDNASAYNNRANAHLELGEYRQAVQDYTHAIRIRPGSAEVYGNRAAARLRLKDYDQARADVAMCRQLGGTPDPDVVKALAEASGR